MRYFSLICLCALVGCSKDNQEPIPTHSKISMQLHPDFPIIEGQYQMTTEWSMNLPSKFNRRFEEDDLVIWKPGFTIWTQIWGNDKDESAEARLEWIKQDTSPDAFNSVTESSNGILRYAYRLEEKAEDGRQAAFYGFSIGATSHVQIAIYFDSPADLSIAEGIWRSLTTIRK